MPVVTYTVERYAPYLNYVDDADGGHMEKAVRIRVIDPFVWETTVSLHVDDFTVAAVKAKAKARLEEYVLANVPDETFTVTF